MKFGVQLYSLRELAAREGAEAVLRTVAQAGYDGVEFAGFYDKTPDEMDALLKKYNLEPVSAHIGADSILPQMPYIDKLKIGNIFIPWVAKETFDDPEKFSSFCSQAADLKDNLLGEGLPVAVATSFDGSVVLGDSYPVCADGHMTVTLSVDGKELGNWEITSVNDMLDSSIELISRYFTLKIGDCVILDFGMGNCELVIGSHLSAVINGKESVNVKIK